MKGSRGATAGGSVLELVLIVAVALGLALGIQAFLVKPFKIPSGSMIPTLEIGQRILVNRLGEQFGDPKVGDVVVFYPPAGAEDGAGVCGTEHPETQACPKPIAKRADQAFVKRVVGTGGDRIKIIRGRVVRNGKKTDESFARPCGDDPEYCTFSTEFTVPKGHFFMMGDNRGESADSRFWGPVPKKWLIGEAFSTYWPPKRIGLL